MEPEEVLGVLRDYHDKMGRLIAKYEATIDHRAGDGLMVFFNDPIPCERPELQAVKLAIEMRKAFARLNDRWQKLGYELGFGIGITSGYATMGIVGFEGRFDYTANGNVVNLAGRNKKGFSLSAHHKWLGFNLPLQNDKAGLAMRSNTDHKFCATDTCYGRGSDHLKHRSLGFPFGHDKPDRSHNRRSGYNNREFLGMPRPRTPGLPDNRRCRDTVGKCRLHSTRPHCSDYPYHTLDTPDDIR